MRKKDLAGQRFGHLVVERPAANRGAQTAWHCRCDCGGSCVVKSALLLDGRTRSCGCIVRKHGMCRSSEYRTWESMKRRCLNKRHRAFPDYGGRGITVCERWLTFDNFYADMGPRPAGASLDRIDNDRGYSPDNCRWASAIVQNNNTRRVRVIEHLGRRATIAEWSRDLGWPHHVICSRLRQGWDAERALAEPWNRRRSAA